MSTLPSLTRYYTGHDDHGGVILALWTASGEPREGAYRLVKFDDGSASFDHLYGDQCGFLKADLRYLLESGERESTHGGALHCLPCTRCKTDITIKGDSDREVVACFGCPSTYVTRLEVGGGVWIKPIVEDEGDAQMAGAA